jgi:hypothetical protein
MGISRTHNGRFGASGCVPNGANCISKILSISQSKLWVILKQLFRVVLITLFLFLSFKNVDNEDANFF